MKRKAENEWKGKRKDDWQDGKRCELVVGREMEWGEESGGGVGGRECRRSGRKRVAEE
jgi:hypothetical protein